MPALAPASNGFGVPGGDPAWTGKNNVPLGGPSGLPTPLNVALVWDRVTELPLSVWTVHYQVPSISTAQV